MLPINGGIVPTAGALPHINISIHFIGGGIGG